MRTNETATRLRARSRGERAERVALGILLAAGLLLMLVAARAAAAEESATRVDKFAAPLSQGATVRVENVSGDVTAVPGKSFSAVVTTTASAVSGKRAQEILDAVRVSGARQNDEFAIVTEWPGSSSGRGRRRRSLPTSSCGGCRINSRFDLVIPPGVAAEIETVSGKIRVQDLDGSLKLANVNGDVEVRGARTSVSAQTVNGRIVAEARALPATATWELKTVNGPVLVTFPRDARFDLSGSTLSGAIASTFSLPRPALAAEPPAGKERREKVREKIRESHRVEIHATSSDDEPEIAIDAEALGREVEESLRAYDLGRHLSVKPFREVRIAIPGARYSGRLGAGGARIALSTLNGNISVLAEGTREADARPLVASRRSVVVPLPPVVVRMPELAAPRRPHPSAPIPPLTAPPLPELDEEPDEIVRGDVAGDFLATGGGSYRVGRVGGRVRIVTRAGEIHVGSAGQGAEVRTYGGDIGLGTIAGELRAQTLAGDVTVLSVGGPAWVETSGGDIRIDRAGGAVEAKTEGGDIRLPAVAGAIEAETGGGEVRLGMTSRQVRAIIVRNAGGDVTLTLPANFRADFDLAIDGTDSEEGRIRSDFPEVAVTRTPESERGSGSVNGGGSRVVVRTSSGSIRIHKAPPSGP